MPKNSKKYETQEQRVKLNRQPQKTYRRHQRTGRGLRTPPRPGRPPSIGTYLVETSDLAGHQGHTSALSPQGRAGEQGRDSERGCEKWGTWQLDQPLPLHSEDQLSDQLTG